MFRNMAMTATAQRILLFLARSPGKEFYVRELVGLLGISVGSCHNNLISLLGKDLVLTRLSGKNRYYQIDPNNPSIKHFKIFANIQELIPIVDEVGPISTKITLFGSCSKGEDTWDSDVDLVVISSDPRSVQRKISHIDLARKVNANILRPHEFMELKKGNRAFHGEVMKGITLWRDKHE